MERAIASNLLIPTSQSIALTGKQKVALMLVKAGYSHPFIAERLKLRHRQSATALIARARAAEKQLLRTITEFFENESTLELPAVPAAREPRRRRA